MVIFQGCRLHCFEQENIYVSWYARSAVIFQGCGLDHLEWAHIYVSWHARGGVIFYTCRLHHLERAHIYVSWNAKSANNISRPKCNMWFRILSRLTLAGTL